MTLSPETRKLLERAREQSEPTAEDRRAVRRRVVAAVGLGAATGVGAAAAAGAAPETAGVGALWALPGVKLVVGLVVVGGLGAAGYYAWRPPAGEPATPAHTAPSATPAPPTSALPPAAPGAPAASATPSPPPRPSSLVAAPVAAPASAAPAASSLQAELEAIRRARASLAASDPEAALAALDDLPPGSGQLAVEREGLAVAARCRRDLDGQSAAGRRFLSQHGSSPVAQTVRTACRLP